MYHLLNSDILHVPLQCPLNLKAEKSKIILWVEFSQWCCEFKKKNMLLSMHSFIY